MTQRAALDIHELTVALPRGADRADAVRDVSVTVGAGEIVCLLGESGSGKSIIAHSVMGLLPSNVKATQGAIRLQGESLLDAGARRLRQLRGQRMSMIFQEPMTALNPVMTCGAQLDELLAYHTTLDAAARRARTLDIFAQVRLPEPRRMLESYPHQLSGGQRQRIMIAMALMLEPALLIADEPTTALDVTTQAEILRLIRQLQREKGTAVLFITHDFGVVAEIADRVAVLKLGELVEHGSKADVLARPRHAYTQMLLASVPSVTPPERAAHAEGAHVVEVRGLSKTYTSGGFFTKRRETLAASDVALAVRHGETVGIVGESGSGKSTVARCVARLIDASAGEIALKGERVEAKRGGALKEFRHKVQIVFQDPYRSLDPRQRVGSSIAEGLINFGMAKDNALRRAAELMDLVHVPRKALERYPHEFSGGQRQRLCIARALAVEPEVLIADEAVSALDVSVQAQILRLLDEIQTRLKLAMIFITHDLRVAAQICDRVLVMQTGRIVEQGDTREVFLRPSHPYTRALLAAAPGRDYAFGAEGRSP